MNNGNMKTVSTRNTPQIQKKAEHTIQKRKKFRIGKRRGKKSHKILINLLLINAKE